MFHQPLKRGGLVAVLLAVSLCATPFVVATADASRKSEKAQNRAIKRARAATARVAKAVKKVGETAGGIDTRLKAIEAAAPQIVDALTQLKNGLVTAGNGLQTLGDAYQAVEYGRAGVTATNGAVAAGQFATSSDIPDDGNVITTGDDAIIRATANPVTVDLRALIRSNESDGDEDAETSGQAGGFVQVTNADTGVPVDCTGSTAPAGIFGTLPGASIVTPSGTVTNLPLKNLPGGHLRTSTTEPTGTDSVSLLPAGCAFAAAAGDDFKVHWSVNFVDIPTSTTPGPKE
jgi:hypothetical protein